MHVLLVQSLTEFDEPPIFPLGLCTIASHLSQHELYIFDMNVSGEPFDDLEKEIRQKKPEVIGLSLRNIKVAKPGVHHDSSEPHAVTIRIIKEISAGALFVVGGAAFSLYAVQLMHKFTEIDIGVFGEAEESFSEVLQNFNNPHKVKGVYYRNNGEIVFTGYRNFLPPEKLVPPNRVLVDISKYADTPYSVGVQSRRGCNLKCIHCSDRFLTGNELRLMDPVMVVDEIEMLKKKYGIRTFFFVDQTFNIPKDHAYKVCREMIRRNLDIKWTAWFNERHIDEDFLRIVKQAGCAHLSFSPDSASNRVLKRIHKNFTKQDLHQSYRLAKKVGLKAEYSFMVNAPGESIFTLFENLSFIIKAKLTLGKDFMLYNLLMTTPIRIYPHTEIRQLAIKEGIIDENNDLTEPVFYNPAPLKYLVKIIGGCLHLAWNLKKLLNMMRTGEDI